MIAQVAAPHISSYTAKSPDRLQRLELHRNLSRYAANPATTLQNIELRCDVR